MKWFIGAGGGETKALGRPRTFFTAVLDDSSSMSGARETTIKAYNDFIRQQQVASKEAKDEVFVSLTKFSDPGKVETLYVGVPLHEVPVLTERDYRTAGGSTALYDGIDKAIRDIERRVGEHARVLMLVITDGQENASVKVTDVSVIKRMVSQRQERGNWTFIFLSAGSNPYETGHAMGFRTGNIQSYGTSKDVGQSLVHVSKSVRSYRQSDAMQTDTFFHGEAPTHERPNWTRTGTEDVEDVV